VHEVALGRGLVGALAEDAELVADARLAQAADAQPDLDRLREREPRAVLAVRLDAEADHVAALDVQAALADQPGVDRRVEVRVVLDVVDVPVHVVVLPAGLYREPVRVVQHAARL
jgi:hypothetical protein